MKQGMKISIFKQIDQKCIVIPRNRHALTTRLPVTPPLYTKATPVQPAPDFGAMEKVEIPPA